MTIKFNPIALISINTMSVKASLVNSGFVSTEMGDMSGLKTAEKYIEYEGKIKTLLSEYKSLVAKDASEMATMLSVLKQLDNSLGTLLSTVFASGKSGGGSSRKF